MKDLPNTSAKNGAEPIVSDVLGHTHAMKERIPFNQSVLCDFIGFLGIAQVV